MDCCTPSQWKKRIPILEWLPRYTWNNLLKDCIAGLTVGLTVIPQGIAYAVVAGLEPQYGLYSGFMGCFVYMVLGTSKDVTIGPTAITALMAQKYVESCGPSLAILLTFLSGVIITSFGLLHLGFLVEFISMPVTVGFTTAAAMTIGSGQLNSLFGLSGKGGSFVESWSHFFQNITSFRPGDTALGISTIVLLLLAKKLKDKSKDLFNERLKFLNSVAWLVGLARNAIMVVLGSLLAYVLSLHGLEPFKLTGTVTPGLPPFRPPPFSLDTKNQTLTFAEMATELGSGIIAIPLICILESIAIAKAFSKGRSLDASQEMIALGICNLAGSFVGSFPTTGSFTRTAVNNASGVTTPAGGIFTGLLVIMALGFLTSTFYFIPKATLAAVIISAIIYMIELHAVKILWKTKKMDLLPFLTTMLTCLFLGLEYGIMSGVCVNLFFILFNSARPELTMHWNWVDDKEVLMVVPSQSLLFPSSEYLRDSIVNKIDQKNSSAGVVLDGTHIYHIDSTVAKSLKILVEEVQARNKETIFWKWKEEPMITAVRFEPLITKNFHFELNLNEVFQAVEQTDDRTSEVNNSEVLYRDEEETLAVKSEP